MSKGSLRDSASLIIAARDHNDNNIYDYSVLLMKRTETTAFFRDHCVFPGGVFEAEDENVEWLEYFTNFGVTKAQLDELINNDLNRPQIFKSTSSKCPKDISLRITALRETFEEVGLLLCRNKENIVKSNTFGIEHQLDVSEKLYWQQTIHKNPKYFLELCKYFRIVPDLWSLQEWSVWRSPVTARKRYDTVIYLTALEKTPHLLTEKTEVADVMWYTPTVCLNIFSERIIWLPPLQFYELSRLTNILDIEELKTYSKKRSKKGSTLLMPVYYKCTDGMVGILPGDDLYPDIPERRIDTILSKLTINDFKLSGKRIHRICSYDMYDMHVDLTINPIDNHLSPIRIYDKSKL